ncbi:hypothetical protein DTO164E3_4519 [Paecilomyces variotii]|nr:hypothetical protein DTO164E3_4519 [Paecilomyces variotii]KAJ9203352.1 hypothetical protein DTO032I3_3219 [Paecilomyces variotii]KAJ9278912.1 hypothetical protein DTO021D3_4228 [Paecilomyces variotii]KAJ9295224.1 hypothetical protein DTO217A2_9083 [Paecilomyces variotii]KAJ9323177.1 hypothetical protein DTO027B3_5748 [Paecilomyces variotii]
MQIGNHPSLLMNVSQAYSPNHLIFPPGVRGMQSIIPSYSGDFSRDPYYQQSMYSALQGVAYDWTDMSNYPNDQFPPNPEIPMIPASNSPLPFNTRQRDGRQNLLTLQDQQARSISPGHQMGSLGQQSSFGGRGDMSFSSGSLPVPSHESNLRGPYPVGMIPTSMQTPPGQYISSPPQYPSNQAQYDFSSQSFRSSYHASISPEPQRSSVATSHIPTSSPGSQSDPDHQVRVIEARPKPQCWDHGCNGREFSTFSNLLRHQRERAGASSKSECPYCGTVFTRTTARNVHISQGKCKAAKESTA